MSDRRDDPMRLWIGKWTPPRPLPAEPSDEKRPATDDDRRPITE